MTDEPHSPAVDQSETDDIIARLKALSAANLGRTASDDEAIDGVCESAVEELKRLCSGLRIIAGESRGIDGVSHSDIARITLYGEVADQPGSA